MNSRTFQFNVSSFIVFFAAFLFLLLPCYFLLWLSLPGKENSTTRIVLFITITIITYFLARKISTAKTKWTVSESEIRVEWQEKLFFQKRPDLIIKWNEIDGYKFRADRNFDLFKLKLISGRTIRFWHNTDFRKDDFLSFITFFEEQVKSPQ